MDKRAFELGYLMGRALSRIPDTRVAAATRGLEASLARIVSLDEMFTGLLEALEPGEWEVWRLEGPWWDFPPRYWRHYGRAWIVLEELPRRAEEAYETGIQHARKIGESMGRSGLHDAVQDLLDSPPQGYGEERESVPPDVRRLGEVLGASPDEVIDLLGGQLTPQETLTLLREARGSRAVFARFLATPNPFTAFRRKLLSLWRRLTPQKVRELWPSRKGWGPALGGAVLVGADIVTAVGGIASWSAIAVTGAIQSVYSIPEGIARMQTGIAEMRRSREQ